MVSTHTSSRGILWKLGDEDIDTYTYTYKSNTNTNTNTNNNSITIDYDIVELPLYTNYNYNDKTNFVNLPFLVKLVKFIKNILYI